ncbi:MAG: hypothetical protein JWM57_2437 [Phycisphaerales bacterium]|nr:hypothetical protein [Phycisphaerales bacterium]
MNTKLDKVSTSPPVAAFITFAGGAIVALLLWLSGAMSRGDPLKLSQAPWWTWLTGPIGVTIILSALIALPRSSAAVVICLMVSGQALSSLAMDHYGWLDVKKIPINGWRIAGVILIIGGTLMMQKK